METVDPSSSASGVTASSFQLVDAQGNVRARMFLDGAAPTLDFYDQRRCARLRLSLAESGNPQALLYDGVNAQAQVTIEADANGSHVLLSGRGEQKSYLFLKASGATGLVFINAAGLRQAEWMLSPGGDSNWSLWDAEGALAASGLPAAAQ